MVGTMSEPLDLSIVVLAWNQLELTRRCVASIRDHTDAAYELIIVDNGSEVEAAAWAEAAADTAVLHATNLGFSKGMNAGLHAAQGSAIAFVNNDTTLPAGWASPLLEILESKHVGIALPAVTAAGNPFAVRTEAGSKRLQVPRFRHLPSGVVYVMDTDVVRALGGWGEEYEIASREDLDLLFKTWVNGLDVVLDEGVLVDHVGQATAEAELEDRDELWKRNRDVFIAKWTAADPDVIPYLGTVDRARFDALLEEARTAAVWMERLFAAEDRIEEWKAEVRAQKRRAGTAERKAEAAGSKPTPLSDLVYRVERRLWGSRSPSPPAD
jgi:GT2 family glycosyltransferase